MKQRAARERAQVQSEDANGAGLLDELVSASRERGAPATVARGEIVGFGADGAPLAVRGGGSAQSALPARSVVSVTDADVGREVVLAFENGDPQRPIVLGFLDGPKAPALLLEAPVAASALRVEVGDARIELHVDREVVVRCGASSLTLAPDGRVVIRGTHLLSRATGSNRIKGGTVQIN